MEKDFLVGQASIIEAISTLSWFKSILAKPETPSKEIEVNFLKLAMILNPLISKVSFLIQKYIP